MQNLKLKKDNVIENPLIPNENSLIFTRRKEMLLLQAQEIPKLIPHNVTAFLFCQNLELIS